jgi:SAM-dependent methyltransferase
MAGPDVGASPELDRLLELGWDADSVGALIDGVRFAGRRIDVDYPDGGLEALGLDGGSSYWFDHRAHEVVDSLRQTTGVRSIWDIGAGTGSMAKRLADAGYDVVAVEPLPDGARAIARLGGNAVFCGSLEQLQLPDASLGAIGLFDVIEHIGDPDPLIREARRVLEPGGVVAITVPALQSLWSDEDEAAGHHRRYRRDVLDGFMSGHGFERATSRYIFACLVLPAAVLRAIPYRLGRRRTADEVIAHDESQLAPSASVDRIMRSVLQLERTAATRVRLPVGLSLIGIYRRR